MKKERSPPELVECQGLLPSPGFGGFDSLTLLQPSLNKSSTCIKVTAASARGPLMNADMLIGGRRPWIQKRCIIRCRRRKRLFSRPNRLRRNITAIYFFYVRQFRGSRWKYWRIWKRKNPRACRCIIGPRVNPKINVAFFLDWEETRTTWSPLVQMNPPKSLTNSLDISDFF